jgi:hypothetical protein
VAAFVFGQFIAQRQHQLRTDRGVQRVIYAILALGLNIVVGWAGLLDLGYVAFFGDRRLRLRPVLLARVRKPHSGHRRRHAAGDTRRSRSPLVGVGLLGLVIGLVALRLSAATTWRS